MHDLNCRLADSKTLNFTYRLPETACGFGDPSPWNERDDASLQWNELAVVVPRLPVQGWKRGSNAKQSMPRKP